MSSKVLTFSPIDTEQQKKLQPASLNYECKVMELVNGKEMQTDDETGFMFHQYAQTAPKEITSKGKKMVFGSSSRNYMKVPIFTDQTSCLEFEKQINFYDDEFAENRATIFGKFDKLYTHMRSVKEPKEADDLDAEVDPEKASRPKFNSVKMRFEMSWNYYLNGQLLDEENQNLARTAFFNARKNKQDPTTVSVKLHFTDDNGVRTTKEVSFADIKNTNENKTDKIVQEKDKILTRVMHRRPDNIPADAKPVAECTEEELVQYYGQGELVHVNTPEDLDKYYKHGCHVRLVYKPLKIYAQRNKNAEGKRNCSYIFEIKFIDIVNTRQNTTSNVSNKKYEHYVFGSRNSTTETTTEYSQPKTTNKNQSVKVVKDDTEEDEKEDNDENDVDGEEQEEQDDVEEDEEDEEEEPVVVTKSKSRSKVVVEEPVKTKTVSRKTK